MDHFEPGFLPLLGILLGIGFYFMGMSKPVKLAIIFTALIGILAALDYDLAMISSLTVSGIIAVDLGWQYMFTD